MVANFHPFVRTTKLIQSSSKVVVPRGVEVAVRDDGTPSVRVVVPEEKWEHGQLARVRRLRRLAGQQRPVGKRLLLSATTPPTSPLKSNRRRGPRRRRRCSQ